MTAQIYGVRNNYGFTLNKTYNLHCLDGLQQLDSNSIDMTLTSPPCDNLRNDKTNISNIWGDFIWKPALKELFRVIKNAKLHFRNFKGKL